MQAVSDFSEKTRRGFEVLSFQIHQLFPGSKTELLPSSFRGDVEGGTVVIHTSEECLRRFYDVFDPIKDLTRKWRDEYDIGFGFDVQVAA